MMELQEASLAAAASGRNRNGGRQPLEAADGVSACAGSETGSDYGVPDGIDGGKDGGLVGGSPTGVVGGCVGCDGDGPVLDYDRPPRPLRLPRPVYPQDAFVRKTEGVVLLEILIDATGKVVATRLLRSASPIRIY